MTDVSDDTFRILFDHHDYDDHRDHNDLDDYENGWTSFIDENR